MTADVPIPTVHAHATIEEIAHRLSAVLIEIEAVMRDAARVEDMPPSAVQTALKQLEQARVYTVATVAGIAAWPSVQGTWRRRADNDG